MDEKWLAFLAFWMSLAFTLIVAFTLKDLFFKMFGGAAHKLSRLLTTSIEIHTSYGVGTNVTDWLKSWIEYKCGTKLGHFGITNDIIRSKSRMQHLIHYFDEVPKKQEENEKGNSLDIRKHLEPLQIGQSMFFVYKWTCIRVARNVVNDLRNQQSPTEVYKITAFATRNKQLLVEMLDEGRKMVEKKPSKHINYYKAQYHMGHSIWRLVRRIQPRSLSSIILKEGVTDLIQKDLEEFIESKEWYKERGIPYRRGYLLYGPPGCGKTSFVKAIAGQVGYDIHELQLSSKSLNDESLNQLMSSISRKAILLFEDVDAIFIPRHQDEERSEKNDGLTGLLKIRESKGNLSFSGLLNAIDGIASEEDYIVFMTTNQIEKLDSALIRPGRIDLRQLIDYPDEKQIVAFFNKFYPNCKDYVAETFAKAVTKLKCNPSVAQIQGIFLKHKHEPEANLQDVDTLIDMCKNNADLAIRGIYL